jgi:serine/threonine protein phosphatase PrpC
VWLKDGDIPGLAMTRSFGDSIGAEAGVICVPEIKEFDLKAEDKYIIIGSDGVWEFISNDEAAAIVYPFYIKNSAEGGVDALVKEAQRRWGEEEDIIDDITCIIAFLECI